MRNVAEHGIIFLVSQIYKIHKYFMSKLSFFFKLKKQTLSCFKIGKAYLFFIERYEFEFPVLGLNQKWTRICKGIFLSIIKLSYITLLRIYKKIIPVSVGYRLEMGKSIPFKISHLCFLQH